MHPDGWVPDIVIGIDFGMTCTAVAYSRGPDWAEPKALQHWPGKMINELANKVPSTLNYLPQTDIVKGWGFLCEHETEEVDIVDCFKLHLDPAFKDSRPNAPTLGQARQWLQDYLRCMHEYLVEYFTDSFPRWKSQKTEFVFSVPTTWKNPGMIAETEKIIKAAGFGKDGNDHRTVIGLTEAEAAAVYASKQQYEKDDIVLVCDAGGGTTDVNVLKLTSGKRAATRLQQMSWVEGRPVGSTSIDIAFHQVITRRLSKIQEHLKDDPELIADEMMQSRFERFKCSYGSPVAMSIPNLLLEVPGLGPGVNLPDAGIDNSTMAFSREELRGLFDEQIDKLIALTDEQIDRVSKKSPEVQISYLILSGGLGSSPYVKSRMREHYQSGVGSLKYGVQKMQIATVAEPQLAVVQGLVMDRIQSIHLGNEIFQERCCRLSYGVVCREEYEPGLPRHIGARITVDPRDGKKWVEDQIVWLVQQGEIVPIDGVMRPFNIKRKPGQEDQPWETKIVMSGASKDLLPTNINHEAAKKLCEVSSALKDKDIDMKLKNRHWYNRGDKYWRCRFDVKVVVGAADLKFLLLTKDKKVISKDHDPVRVRWENPGDPKPSFPAGTPTRKHISR